jgi:hypothetical protein
MIVAMMKECTAEGSVVDQFIPEVSPAVFVVWA